MTAFLTSLLGNEKLARAATRILIALALIGAVLIALKLYGDSRFKAGRETENAAWHAASEKLIQQAATSAKDADKAEVARVLDHTAKVEKEKERIDAAIENGSSPFDALFPPAPVM
ncbi:MAG: hypothetical protein J7500_15850 [Sphingomonas sp.]|uniref:hypothetical protein n=1 Tax=Sphingomonas sp. TaxID=28214 RepID=UPI001B0DCBB9|nr:hypothetical protein [Sphingomonas sp.]MBO9624182.1 hypothetical protein [Sphingomonas sp.]